MTTIAPRSLTCPVCHVPLRHTGANPNHPTFQAFVCDRCGRDWSYEPIEAAYPEYFTLDEAIWRTSDGRRCVEWVKGDRITSTQGDGQIVAVNIHEGYTTFDVLWSGGPKAGALEREAVLT